MFLSDLFIFSFFFPIFRVSPYHGSRCLLHLGTHRREYQHIDINSVYYMTNYCGLGKCTYVDPVRYGDSTILYNVWLCAAALWGSSGWRTFTTNWRERTHSFKEEWKPPMTLRRTWIISPRMFFIDDIVQSYRFLYYIAVHFSIPCIFLYNPVCYSLIFSFARFSVFLLRPLMYIPTRRLL